MRSGNVADKETDSMQLSDYHYLGFIMGDRNLQKIIHTARTEITDLLSYSAVTGNNKLGAGTHDSCPRFISSLPSPVFWGRHIFMLPFWLGGPKFKHNYRKK